MMLKPHLTNPHGVLVPCASCGRELHVPRADFTERGVNPGCITCSWACKEAAAELASLRRTLPTLRNPEVREAAEQRLRELTNAPTGARREQGRWDARSDGR